MAKYIGYINYDVRNVDTQNEFDAKDNVVFSNKYLVTVQDDRVNILL